RCSQHGTPCSTRSSDRKMPVNIKNPAIKRIHADVRELMKDPSDQYHAAPLESNLFEWHFTIRGPPATEFEGGVYHGRIILPPMYPFRPPDIVFNTPNGRFSTGMKVCLTISSFHPEHWQPAWGIRLILEALISFFPSPSQGALGGLDWSAEERKKLAVESREWKCIKCGVANDLLPELRPKGEGASGGGGGKSSYADQIKELHKLKAKTAAEVAAESMASPGTAAAAAATASDSPDREGGDKGGADAKATTAGGAGTAGSERIGESGSASETAAVAGAPVGAGDADEASPADGDESPGGAVENEEEGATQQPRQGRESAPSAAEREDDMLSFFAVAIALAIVGILVRKALRLFQVF
ncbi:unnamed protein product, partial [Hapterophycus canaliculatus]